jgi:hypothetical protein
MIWSTTSRRACGLCHSSASTIVTPPSGETNSASIAPTNVAVSRPIWIAGAKVGSSSSMGSTDGWSKTTFWM